MCEGWTLCVCLYSDPEIGHSPHPHNPEVAVVSSTLSSCEGWRKDTSFHYAAGQHGILYWSLLVSCCLVGGGLRWSWSIMWCSNELHLTTQILVVLITAQATWPSWTSGTVKGEFFLPEDSPSLWDMLHESFMVFGSDCSFLEADFSGNLIKTEPHIRGCFKCSRHKLCLDR